MAKQGSKRQPGVTPSALEGMMRVKSEIEGQAEDVQRKIDALLIVKEMAERGEVNILVLAPGEDGE